MQTIDYTKDLVSLTNFRDNAATFVDQVNQTKRPLVLTRRGKAAALLVDAEQYQSLLNTIADLQAIREGLRQVDNDEVIDNEQFKTEMQEFINGLDRKGKNSNK